MTRRLLTLLVACCSLALLAPPAVAADRTLVPIDVVTASDVPEIASPYGTALSRDGRFLFVASANGSVVSFRRDDRGRLTEVDSVALSGAANYLAVSPDGSNLYVTSTSGAVDVVRVGARGALSGAGTVTAGPGAQLAQAFGVTVTRDGRFVYVSDGASAGAINVYRRNATTGALTFASLFTFDGTLASPLVVALSADGRQLYTTECGGDAALVVARRNTSSGALTAARRRPVGDGAETCPYGIGVGEKTVVVSGYTEGALTSYTRTRRGALAKADTLAIPALAGAYYVARPGGGPTFFAEGYVADSVVRATVAPDGDLRKRAVLQPDRWSGPYGLCADRRNLYVSGYASSSIVAYRRR